MPKTADGLREAWSIVERTWRSTFERARQLPESVLHENVNGEWSFVETQRHLLFATDVWIRRSVLDDPGAWHRLGMPPDLRTGQPDPDGVVGRWGIDVCATPSLDEVLDVRDQYLRLVRDVVDDLSPEKLGQPSAHNPPWVPPATAVPMSDCLGVVVREEWEHHGFATRDLALLEQRTS
jgi:hypothetical protein